MKRNTARYHEDTLEKYYKNNSYPKKDDKKAIMAITKLEYNQVEQWFCEKRRKERMTAFLAKAKQDLATFAYQTSTSGILPTSQWSTSTTPALFGQTPSPAPIIPPNPSLITPSPSMVASIPSVLTPSSSVLTPNPLFQFNPFGSSIDLTSSINTLQANFTQPAFGSNLAGLNQNLNLLPNSQVNLANNTMGSAYYPYQSYYQNWPILFNATNSMLVNTATTGQTGNSGEPVNINQTDSTGQPGHMGQQIPSYLNQGWSSLSAQTNLIAALNMFSNNFNSNGAPPQSSTDSDRAAAINEDLCSTRVKIEIETPDTSDNQWSVPKMKYRKVYTCLVCSAIFDNFTEHRQHLITSHPEGRFQCDECDKNYSRKYNLKVHKRISHSDEVIEIFPCEACKTHYESKTDLLLHKKEKHADTVTVDAGTS